MNRKRKTLETRAEVEHVVREACLASARLDEVVARMNEAVALAKEPFEAEIASLKAGYDALEEIALEWAKAHPEEFATAKSVAMVHGTIGFRLGQPSLKTLKGVTWDTVLRVLRDTMPAFVRRTEEVDKEALIAARRDLGDENLRTIGVRVAQKERCYLEVNKDSLTDGGR